jgi:hypothetical protein
VSSKPDIVNLPTIPVAVECEPADENWHPAVIRLYDSLAKSGEVQFFEPSDWAFARLTCDILTRWFADPEKMPAMLVSSCMANLTRLGVTEGDRRRMRVELERGGEQAEPASVAIMAKYRNAAKGR